VGDVVIVGRPVVAGSAEGEALVTREPLSFWGGYDFHTGRIIDQHHPLAGVCAAGRVLAVPFTKGSSTTTAVLLEAVRAGTAPAAILTTDVDSFFALASIVAGVMYGKSFPVVALEPADFQALETGTHMIVEASGVVRIERLRPERAPSGRESE
jgi:predicted aconitase with swiveling domain